MNTPTHDDNPHHTITAVADRVAAALRELDRTRYGQGPLPTTDEGRRARCLVNARAAAREAGWWALLLHHDGRPDPLHPLCRRAAAIAYRHAQDDARFWRDTAAEYTARIDRRPTSDAAGALSNWDELGVTA